MRFPCRLMTGVAVLTAVLGLSASAQTDTNEGTDESELRDRVRQLEKEQDERLGREISAIKKEIDRLEQAAAKRKAASSEAHPKRPESVAASDNRWRFKYHQGRWWYWMPDKQWVYWSTNRWLRLPQRTAAVQSVDVHAAGEKVETSQSSSVSKGDQATRDASDQNVKAAASTPLDQPSPDAKGRDSSEHSESRPAKKKDGATRAR